MRIAAVTVQKERQGAKRADLAAPQSDIVKDYFSRGTNIFPPGRSRRGVKTAIDGIPIGTR